MKMQILKNEIREIEVAVEELKKGNVVAIPTETVYGLAANALSRRLSARYSRQRAVPRIIL